MNDNNPLKVGLGLSGGGFRAAAFHIGVLNKLRNLNLLDKIDVLSTISGGSIVGGYFALHPTWHDCKVNKLEKFLSTQNLLLQLLIQPSVILKTWLPILMIPVCTFTLTASYPATVIALFLALITFLIFQHRIISFTIEIAKLYDKHLFKGTQLSGLSQTLPQNSSVSINATNLATGRQWYFSQKSMGDSAYTYRNGGAIKFQLQDLPLSHAVASSTAYPLLFAPYNIKKKYFVSENDYQKVRPALVDGGIYDNQGMHKLTASLSKEFACDIIICSDGASPFQEKFYGLNIVSVLVRSINVMMRRIRNLQFAENVYDKDGGKIREIAFVAVDWNYEQCIQGFVRNAQKGLLSPTVQQYHFPGQDVTTLPPETIESRIKAIVEYDRIIADTEVTSEDINNLSQIATKLSALTNGEVQKLIKHAETLTEIQLRMYCPSLFNS